MFRICECFICWNLIPTVLRGWKCSAAMLLRGGFEIWLRLDNATKKDRSSNFYVTWLDTSSSSHPEGCVLLGSLCKGSRLLVGTEMYLSWKTTSCQLSPWTSSFRRECSLSPSRRIRTKPEEGQLGNYVTGIQCFLTVNLAPTGYHHLRCTHLWLKITVLRNVNGYFSFRKDFM